MRIAIFPSTFLPDVGGAELATHNLVLQLRAKGHDARVITWWGNRSRLRAMVPYPVHHLLPKCYDHAYTRRFRRASSWLWYGAAQVAALQLRHRFDVWNIHWVFPAIVIAAPALRLLEVPLLATCHGGDIMIEREFMHGHRQDPVINEAILGGLRNATALSCISPAIRDAYQQAGLGDHAIIDIPNGIDYARIRMRKTDRDGVRARFGIPSGKHILLTVANYRMLKGLESIPRIAVGLAGRGLDFIWLLVGKGCERVAAEASAVGVGDRVRVLHVEPSHGGGLSNLPCGELIDIYLSADVYVATSRVESFSLVLLEAMAAGLAVVARDIPGHRTALVQGRQGYLVAAPPDDEFIQPIEALLRDSDMRRTMGAQSMLTASAYDWPLVADRYLAAYRRLVGEGDI